ncbi:HD domain-containing protein [Desulfopila sp. IMCC35006]|uniref:HD domain-containing protein n=1 Tax=Desulfopila sp. IMCC35006 TaxID=2569542 RepID=UPI0010AB5D8D|nr:HD domain-containing protein [Desulfopila sp. IMCC35006]TKB25850.1 HD domain-containing protein [Desulfopila sp. IMCC35006]
MLWLALGLAVVVIMILFFGKKKIAKEIHLHELSKIWTKEGSKTIHISELSPLWRNQQSVPGDDEFFEMRSPRAVAFMKNILHKPLFEKFPQQKAVCGRILKLLDKEGNCPSVVDIHGDVEGNWDENTYRLLAQTTLLDHSLNVAEQVVQILSDNKAWHVIPDTMVAALAHDLGKLQSLRGYLYSLGEHPLAAGRPLAGIGGFNELPKKDEILRAVRLHHKMVQGLLGKTLKKADQLARQKELEATVLHEDTGKEVNENIPADMVQPETRNITTAARQVQADIYSDNDAFDQEKSKPIAPKLMDISGWFDASQFLEDLKPYINKMFGRRFLAFSMPNGHVYFQVKVLEEVARKQAEKAGNMEIAAMAQKDETMRQVLFTIVHHLRAEHEIIDRGLIKDSFFGGYFTVTRKIGKSIKGYYTPFHAERFGSIAEMEEEKPAMLRDIVKVSPYLDNNDSQDA